MEGLTIRIEPSPGLLAVLERIERAIVAAVGPRSLVAPPAPAAAATAAPAQAPAAPAPDAPARAEVAGDVRPPDVSSPKLPQRAAPSGAAAAALSDETRIWTAARDAHLVMRWPMRAREPTIRAELAAMPGAPLPEHINTLPQRASRLGVRRSPDFRDWLRTGAPCELLGRPRAAPATPAPAAPEPATSIPAKSDQIRRWASERGIDYANSADLPAVNRKRKDLGLPPFALAPSAGRLTSGILA